MTAKSTTRSLGIKPTYTAGKGAFDNFKETTELSRQKLGVIRDFLQDYKKTYTELEKNADTAAFIRDKRERNELSKQLSDKLQKIAMKGTKRIAVKQVEKKEDTAKAKN